MNEKKAIVFFFFFVVVFFSFLLLLLAGGVCFATYVTYVFLSPVCFVCVCVLFFSFALTCVCLLLVCVCDCVFQFPLFCCCCCCFFFGGLSLFQTLPFLRTWFFLRFFLLLLLNVVIRGGVFLHFFLMLSNNTHTRAHVLRRTHHAHTRTHRQTTDGMGEKSARAPLVLGGTHKTILRLLIVVLLVVVVAIIMIGCCCCYSLFAGCFFLFFSKDRERVRVTYTRLLSQGGGNYTQFSTLPRCTFWKLASYSSFA